MLYLARYKMSSVGIWMREKLYFLEGGGIKKGITNFGFRVKLKGN